MCKKRVQKYIKYSRVQNKASIHKESEKLLYYTILFYIMLVIRVHVCDKIKFFYLILINIHYVSLLGSTVLGPKGT